MQNYTTTLLKIGSQKEDLPAQFLDYILNQEKTDVLDRLERVAEEYTILQETIRLAEICYRNDVDFSLYKAIKKQLF